MTSSISPLIDQARTGLNLARASLIYNQPDEAVRTISLIDVVKVQAQDPRLADQIIQVHLQAAQKLHPSETSQPEQDQNKELGFVSICSEHDEIVPCRNRNILPPIGTPKPRPIGTPRQQPQHRVHTRKSREGFLKNTGRADQSQSWRSGGLK